MRALDKITIAIVAKIIVIIPDGKTVILQSNESEIDVKRQERSAKKGTKKKPALNSMELKINKTIKVIVKEKSFEFFLLCEMREPLRMSKILAIKDNDGIVIKISSKKDGMSYIQ